MASQEDLGPGTQEVACWTVNHETLLLAVTHYSDWIRSKEPVSFSTDSSSKAKGNMSSACHKKTERFMHNRKAVEEKNLTKKLVLNT